MSAMTAVLPRLIVSRQVGCSAEVLACFPQAEFVAQLDPAGLGQCVVLLTADEAARLCEQCPSPPVMLVWRKDGTDVPAELAGHRRVAAILDGQCRADAIQAAIRTAQSLAAHGLEEARIAQRLERVLEVGRALAAEKDLDTLLSLILDNARALTDADGASIYTRERDGQLYFRLWQNSSVPNSAGVERRAVGEDSIAGYVARTSEAVVLDDAYAMAPEAPYHFNPVFDQSTGYRTRSLLTVPLTNKGGEVVGVLQLINRKDDAGARLDTHEAVARHVRGFDGQDRAIAQALAGQAGVALENSLLHADIERLFEGFIRASVAAIEARDPTTAGHSFRVAEFTERLALAVDRSDEPELRDLRFTRDGLREIRYAALLHDFGKVGVREDVLVKAKKLYPHQLDQLKQRFKYARLSVAWQHYRQLFELFEQAALEPEALCARRREIERQVAAEHQRLERYLHTILRANEPTVLHASAPEELREIQDYRFPDEDGHLPLLHDFEFSGLSLPKGSLSADERLEIESHVSHTYSFLSLIPWTRDLARLPEYAYAHHEKLDGSGYPRGLTRNEIPVQARMMTISDIYDALTAPDRPYKLAVPVERALAILEAEAGARKVDATLLRVFIESGAWRLAS
jgi:HD-GYP domain-containing protein (c-di-GMP phosphodiesterase class II)